MSDRLHPTPARLALVAEAEAGTLPLLLTARMVECKDAGWIELATPAGPWRPTPYGRAIKAIRIQDRDDGKHVIAETGDPDQPRHLGDAWPVGLVPAARRSRALARPGPQRVRGVRHQAAGPRGAAAHGRHRAGRRPRIHRPGRTHPTVKLDINITDLDLTSVIGDVAVWNEDAERYDTQGQTLGALVAEKLTKSIRESEAWPEIKKRVTAIRDDEIRACIVPQIEQAMTEPIRKTNNWGEPTGAATTMRELIVDEVKKFMSAPADRHYRDKGTVLEKYVRDEVQTTIKKELADVLADEKAKVVAAVRAKAAELIADAVKQGVGR